MRIKLYILIFSLAVILIPFRAVFGGESALVEGDVAVKGQLADVNGNEAKFNEYSDTKDGVFGNIDLNHETDRYYLRLNSEDIAYDTQKYMIDGGMWGKFSYDLYYMEIPHNITNDARTFLSGAGRDSLSGTPNSNLSTWKEFDYSTERKIVGGGLNFDMLRPFFVNIEVRSEDKTGNKVAGVDTSLDTVEVPEPVDYTTNSFSIEAGYNKRPFYASLDYYYSKFENDNQSLTVITSSRTAITLPPDNDYHRIGFKAAVGELPFNTRLSTNIGISEANSDYKLIKPNGKSAGETFNGKIRTENYDVVVTSHPVSMVDGKVYYKYFKDKNKSDEIFDINVGEANELLSYKKESYGTLLGFKIARDWKLTAKYGHMDTRYDNRIDANKRKDDTFGADLSWTGLDFLTVDAGYERMNRRTDRPPFDPAAGVDISRYDVSPFHRDTYTISFDVTPLEELDVSLGYKYKETDYNDTTFGIKGDQRNEFYIDANYIFSEMVKLYGYFDYEKVRAKQINSYPSFYDWSALLEEKNYDYGIGSDIYAIPEKLTITLQYDNVKSDGNADFTYLGIDPNLVSPGATNSNIDISNSDDYRKQAFSIKAAYKVLEPLTVTGGYVYEQYKYSDAQLDGYQYTGPLYLSGAFKDSSYNASVVYVTTTYKF